MDPKRRLSDKQFCFLCAAAALIVLTTAALFLSGKKKVEFCDESLSLESANSVWKDNIYEKRNRWMSGEDVELYYAATDLNPHLITIMQKLWVDHVPFYFWLLRFASLIGYGSASPMIGLGLNLFLALLFFLWLFTAAGKRTAYDRRVTAGVLLLTALFFLTMPVFLSMLTLIRMYLLFCLLELLLAWYVSRFLMEEEAVKKKTPQIAYVVVSACGLITHYLFLPFFGILAFLSFCVILIRQRKKIWCFIRMNIFTLLLSCLMDPYWIYRLFRYNLHSRAGGQEQKVFEPFAILWGVIKKLCVDAFSGKLDLLPAALLILAVFTVAFLLLRKNGRKAAASYGLLLLAADFLYLFAVNVMNNGTGRYQWPPVFIWTVLLYAALIYIFLALLVKAKGKQRLFAFLPAAALGLILCFNLLRCTEKDGIDSLHADSVQPLLEENYAAVPWMVYYKERSWCEENSAYKYMIPEKICFISAEYPAEGLEIPDEILLLVPDWNLTEALDYLELLKEADAEWSAAVTWESMGAYLVRFKDRRMEE